MVGHPDAGWAGRGPVRGSLELSILGDIPAIRRFGTWFVYLLGFYGFGGLAQLGAGVDDLSDGEVLSGGNTGILLSNTLWVAGMVTTFVWFRRSCNKTEQAEGTRMHPVAVLCTGIVLTVALTLLATAI